MNRLVLGFAAVSFCAPAVSAQCTTERLSTDSSGAQADATSGLASPNVHRNFLSADGRYVAFWSAATNLVGGDLNGRNDVFVKDRWTGLTERVSVDSGALEADGDSSDPAISADGRFVAFQSSATNLVAGDTNGKVDVFVRDRALGTTVRASRSTGGVEGDADSLRPDLSADARFVVFHSASTTLVGGDTNGALDVFVHDLLAGVTNRVSVGSSFSEGNGASLGASISATGRYVAFHSFASNLAGPDGNGHADVFVRDRGSFTTTRISTASDGSEADAFSQYPSINADGRYVAFSSFATNLVPGDTNNVFDVFVKDRVTGAIERASVSQSGAQGNSTSQGTSISADGRYVGFLSAANNLVPNDTNGGGVLVALDVFVRDLEFDGTSRLSVDSSDTEAASGDSFNVCVARDGSAAAFYSQAQNLASGDTNAVADVFVRSCGGTPPPLVYCAGDGSGATCPCNNSGQPGHGCDNSFATGGGRLDGSGTSSVSADTFTLAAFGLPPTSYALLFQGESQVNGGLGTTFGDGLRCVSGTVLRLGTRLSSAGSVAFGAAVAGDVPISVRGLVPGGTVALRTYQMWYRNTATFCTLDGFNLTNGVAVTWIP